MNSLFSKCYPKSKINLTQKLLKLTGKKTFTSAGVNPLLNLNGNFVANVEDKETLHKLQEKDVDYFVNLSENKGAEEVLRKLANISVTLDATTKLGRELLNTKNEIEKRVVYQNRTIEDHENMSINICEKELYQVYAEHLKQLDERVSKVANLQSKSVGNSRLIYEYKQSLYSSKYFLSPLMIAAVPTFLASKYYMHLQLLFGSSTPFLVMFGAFYLAARRYKWLTSNSYIRDGNIARKVFLEDDNTLSIDSLELFSMKKHKFNLNTVQIHHVENEVRRESYYLIRDLNSKKTFILPLDDNSVADRKLINWLRSAKTEDKYSITSTLVKSGNFIDVSAHKEITKEIDNFARLNLLSELNPGLDLSTLTASDLHQRLNSISDAQVKEYLQQAKSQVDSRQPAAIESSLVEVENFLVSLGLTNEEAVNVTKYLRKHFKISHVSDLKHLSAKELSESLENNSQKGKSEVNSLLKEIQLFFKKF